MIEKHHFSGKIDGQNILFTGRIHGNEPCGEIALRRLMDDINNGSITLTKGSLTILPCCNAMAKSINKRFVDVNLNRIFDAHLINQYLESHEAKIVPHIMEEIEQSDVFIDLHSFTENMPPVVICIDNQNQQSRELAQACRIKRIECDSPFITKSGSQMSTHFARKHNKPAILVECGQHDDAQSIEVAYQSILNILKHLNMIDGTPSDAIDHEFLVVRSALYHEAGQSLLFPLMEKDYVHVGDDLFQTEHGDILKSHDTGLLFMRNPNTPVGEEYAYICDVYDDWP